MSNDFKTLPVETRENTGKGYNRRLRKSGIVPAVYYAADGTNRTIQANYKQLEKLYSELGRTKVFQIELNGKHHPALFWDIKRDPCKSTITHVDFYGVDLDKVIKIEVPITFVGSPKGLKIGGELFTYHEKLLLAAKPLDMPSRIELDISNLDLNQSIQVSDVKLPDGVTAMYESNFTIVAVQLPDKDSADDATAGADAGAGGATPAATTASATTAKK